MHCFGYPKIQIKQNKIEKLIRLEYGTEYESVIPDMVYVPSFLLDDLLFFISKMVYKYFTKG